MRIAHLQKKAHSDRIQHPRSSSFTHRDPTQRPRPIVRAIRFLHTNGSSCQKEIIQGASYLSFRRRAGSRDATETVVQHYLVSRLHETFSCSAVANLFKGCTNRSASLATRERQISHLEDETCFESRADIESRKAADL
jgi:hypothetical protein